MAVKVGYSTPMLHVEDTERSLAFYEKLGFETIDTDGCKPIGWARMHCEGGALMFLRAEERMERKPLPFLLYMYTPDLPALREQLVAAGVTASEIKRPPYMPSGEMSVTDPDGYMILVAHWSDKEHEEWLKRLRGIDDGSGIGTATEYKGSFDSAATRLRSG